jgi:trans-aconitate methyltransferase
MADRVGPEGQVPATDIGLTWLAEAAAPSIEIRWHDVVRDDPPVGEFDLVHARLVLCHLPGRDEAMRRMVRALRPGGWLVVEDFDVSLQPRAVLDAMADFHHRANRVRDAFEALLGQRGVGLGPPTLTSHVRAG